MFRRHEVPFSAKSNTVFQLRSEFILVLVINHLGQHQSRPALRWNPWFCGTPDIASTYGEGPPRRSKVPFFRPRHR